MDVLTEHDRDFVGWTQRQAAILRALPVGTYGLDTLELAEEVEDLGLAEIRAVSSLLRQTLVHLIKLALEPDSPAVPHWIGEVITFQGNAVLALTPGIRQRINLERIWTVARNGAARELELRGSRLGSLPRTCPFALADLLSDDFDPRSAVEILRTAA